jgi:hypothetical protein
MNTITKGIAGAALAAGLALTGGVAANAADGIAAVADQDQGCRTAFSAKERGDGYTEYELGITCDRLAPGTAARAVATFQNEDGTQRKVPTAWVDQAPGSAGIRIATKAKAIDVRIERLTPAIPTDG